MTRRRGWGFGLDMSQTLIRPSRLADSMLDKSEMVIFWRGLREALPSRYQRPCQIYDTPPVCFRASPTSLGLLGVLDWRDWPALPSRRAPSRPELAKSMAGYPPASPPPSRCRARVGPVLNFRSSTSALRLSRVVMPTGNGLCLAA
jgi:hypothetical protein